MGVKESDYEVKACCYVNYSSDEAHMKKLLDMYSQ